MPSQHQRHQVGARPEARLSLAESPEPRASASQSRTPHTAMPWLIDLTPIARFCPPRGLIGPREVRWPVPPAHDY